jgi:hypothetical protein
MTGTLVNGALLGLLVLGAVVCIVAPLTAFGVMFWKWQKELSEAARIRQARTTQVR